MLTTFVLENTSRTLFKTDAEIPITPDVGDVVALPSSESAYICVNKGIRYGAEIPALTLGSKKRVDVEERFFVLRCIAER